MYNVYLLCLGSDPGLGTREGDTAPTEIQSLNTPNYSVYFIESLVFKPGSGHALL